MVRSLSINNIKQMRKIKLNKIDHFSIYLKMMQAEAGKG